MNHLHPLWKLALLLLSSTLVRGTVQAQSRITATRNSEIDAFAAFTGVDNNFTPPLANYGGTLGADYTKFITHFRGLITPSFQVRGTYTPGGSVDLKSIEGGLKLATTYHRFHPYGDLLLGNGTVKIPNPTPTDPKHTYLDSSFLYIFGAGVTYDLKYPNLSLMLDYQHQYYDLGQQPPLRFYPKAYSFGVVYHIPFKAYKTR